MDPGVLTRDRAPRSERDLSSACRAYAITVGSAGLLPLVWAGWSVATNHPHPAWWLLAGMAVLCGPLCVRIPSIHATISVSEAFIFTAALLFGPAAATAIAAVDGLAVSLWSTRRSLLQTLFGIGEPAVCVSLASLLFYRLAGVPPLLHHATPFSQLAVPLVALTGSYFVLNTALAGTAVWLENGGAPSAVLKQHLRHVVLEFCVSLALTSALTQTGGNLTLVATVIVIPMLLASYISSHHGAARLEDTNRHLSELRRLYDSTVETLAMAIDAKDQVTAGHIRRVQTLCRRLATALGASAAERQALEAAALLHDLGKLAVPEHILNKPGPLTPVEFDAVKKHVEVGASILSSIEFPYPVVPVVRHHHENWDGSGYPDRLRGTAIPLGARILAVVDCYDALTSDRPYRRRMTHDDAMEIVRTRSGIMYDPDVVDAFIELQRRPDAASDPAAISLSALQPRVPQTTSVVLPAIKSAAERRAPSGLRWRATQLVAPMHGLGWYDAGQAIAASVRSIAADSVAALFQFDAAGQNLVVAGLDRTFDGRIPTSIEVGRGVSGWVAANRRPIANADAELDLGEIAGIAHPPLRMCVSVPVLTGEGELAGVFTVYSPYAFSETERLLIQYIADEIAGALENRGAPVPMHNLMGAAIH
jgi:putative nucleotidyltransferase with HDIG domain